ncbi:histone-lysine N-methyltransferase 2D-like isoform X2 [Oncorhynchus nerka]|uniref:histone-lysine N-methyltransferase 2D-like isoform X2 n=1 Tax=Oncorhynchus nerka TaxID=8023 RepID=UPI0011329387|nr:histone-lysine N-methyltransferase 2D-like isoform X2 [Oncorhynchus nerka]
MPSKRKKNKRRMRRVQAQRKVLEEQHVAGTGKGTPGVAAVAAPPVKAKEVAKCPKLVPIQTRVVNVPVVALLAPVEVPEPKPMVAALEAEVVAAEVEVEAPVEAPVEAEEATLEVEAPIETPDVVDGPVEAPEETAVGPPTEETAVGPPTEETAVGPPTEETAGGPPTEETAVGPPTEETAVGPPTEETAGGPPTEETAVGPPTEETAVGPPTEETAAVQEVEESFIPKTELVMEAASIPEAPVSAPDQFETHDEPLVKAEVEAEIVATVQAEVEAVVEPESGPVVEAVAAPVVETEEVVIDTEDSPEVEAEVIPMGNADAIPEEVEVEEAPVVTEDEPVTTEAPEEVPVETEMIPETLSEPVVASVHEAPVANVAPSEPLVEAPVDPVIDTVADNFIITESVPTLEAAMAEPAIEEQVPAVPTDSLEALSELLNNVPPVSEPAPVTADKVIAAGDKDGGERDDTLPPDYRHSPEDLLAKEGIEAQMEIESKKDATDENTALDVLSGHFSAPQPVISELQCHTQLASVPVELASVDIPAEAALNGHTATEVAIEG